VRTAEHVGHPLVRTVGLVVAAVLIVVDQATKQLALVHLEPGRFVPWLHEVIGWQLVFNPGGAFGIGAPPWIFLVVTVIVVAVVARSLPRCQTVTSATAYGLLLAGAIGNVLDRLFRPGGPDAPAFGGGEVVDFVAWGTFPRFNVADSAITVGFVLLVLGLLLEERAAMRAQRAAAAADGSDGAEGLAGPDGTGEW
jgi:signal peptidase II